MRITDKFLDMLQKYETAQAERFFERLNKILGGDNSICELAALQVEPRADFEFLAENLVRIIPAFQKQVEFFAENKKALPADQSVVSGSKSI